MGNEELIVLEREVGLKNSQNRYTVWKIPKEAAEEDVISSEEDG